MAALVPIIFVCRGRGVMIPFLAIDGDTFHYGTESIRLLNIDAPEIHGKCDAERLLALAAKDKLSSLLQGPVEIHRQGKDKYRRTLATITVTGGDAGTLIIRAHLAVAWEGRRHDWCS
jgi:micrococcal nuclease